jgi:hypothetical protein
MSDSADDTATGLQPGTIQLDSALTVSCTTGQADDTILTFAGELDAVSAEQELLVHRGERTGEVA